MPSAHSPDDPARSREEQARLEVGETTVSRLVAGMLVIWFAATVLGATAFELVRLDGRAPSAAWAPLRDLAETVRARSREAGDGRVSQAVAANRAVLAALDAVETGLEQHSALGQVLRPPAQLWLSTWLGAGNERVYVGREGWLFYRPDVEYVTQAPFLDARQQAHRVTATSEWEAAPATDPVAAIVELKLDLDRRGITLLVVPTPVKPSIHPERLAVAYGDVAVPVQNPSFAALVRALRGEGVLVFDPAQALVSARAETGAPQYLRTDTHWRPEAMQRVAAEIGRFLEQQARFGAGATPYQRSPTRVRQAGDTVQMLDLPAGQQPYPPEEVEVVQVLEADGTPWRPTRGAEVMLLGDSFTNIYALDSLGWGTSAGLAEHLSAVLQRPVDRLTQNDQGAWATRAMLQRVSATDPERLARTRLVIYQFATRELAQGDWRRLRLADQ